MRNRRIIGLEHIPLYPVEQLHHLVFPAHIDVVMQVTLFPELHSHTRRKIQIGIGAHEAPGAK